MQFENKRIHETFEDIDLNDMVRHPFLFFLNSEILLEAFHLSCAWNANISISQQIKNIYVLVFDR